jgi:hypothetical protein
MAHSALRCIPELYSPNIREGASLLKKALSEYSVAQDSAEILENKARTLQKQEFLDPGRAQKPARRSR